MAPQSTPYWPQNASSSLDSNNPSIREPAMEAQKGPGITSKSARNERSNKRPQEESQDLQSRTRPRKSDNTSLPTTPAIFRPPSAKAKRHTRPPISSLFSSLHLSPETFLKLQTAAKEFMLDATHPDRLDETVGERGKADGDAVRLKLWNAVREFLNSNYSENRSVGEEFFSAGSEGREERDCEWPQDDDKVVMLLTPLLRRVVTNEKQRRYANDARKGGSHTVARKPPKEDEEDSVSLKMLFVDAKHGRVLRQHEVNVSLAKARDEETYLTKLGLTPDTLRISLLLPQGLTPVKTHQDWQMALQRILDTPWMEGQTKAIITADDG